jgi:muramoyltetrapeptide carboxypeptidase LdcA involved in peptidoglycan recycling
MDTLCFSPTLLQVGSPIFVADCSNAKAGLNKTTLGKAIATLEAAGFPIRWAPHIDMTPENGLRYAPDETLAANFNAGILDDEVNLIISAVGGSTSKYILDRVRIAELVERKKLFCGFSDNASVCSAIARQGGVSIYGPSLINFGDPLQDYTFQNWLELVTTGRLEIKCPPTYVDNPGDVQGVTRPAEYIFPSWEIVQQGVGGKVHGPASVGNVHTYCRLYDEHRQNINGSIVFVETAGGDAMEFVTAVDYILSLGRPAAVCVGMLPAKTAPNRDFLIAALKDMPSLNRETPVILGVPSGHIAPRTSIGIGGLTELNIASDGSITLVTTLEKA